MLAMARWSGSCSTAKQGRRRTLRRRQPAHGALWESASDTSAGRGDDPKDAWLERMDRPMDEFDISTEDYLGVMQGRVRLEDVGAC